MCTRGNTSRLLSAIFDSKGLRMRTERKHTWLVHTLLNVTKANVCASIVDGRSFFARSSGRAKAERNNCGMNARDSSFIVWVEGEAEER